MIEILQSIGRVRRAVNLLAVKQLKPLGLGSKQASALRFLSSHRLCSRADLARHTITDPAATGRILDTLIRRGLIVQKAHPTDRRRWMLALTPEGRRLAGKIAAVFEGIAETLARRLDPQERRALVLTLDKISDSLAPKAKKTKELS
ncbi:MAG TPA: MarR family transcriptional regulator [bacterium]|jgi:MarR family transcriptional regulator for hemolysin|nr:MarR family transcriptional regulator [bacterium]